MFASGPLVLALVLVTGTAAANEVLSDLSFRDSTGGTHQLKALTDAGRSMVFVFWQPWCTSCAREAPALVKAAKDYKKRLQFFGVVSGKDEFVDDTRVDRFIGKYSIPYPLVRDRDLSLTEGMTVEGTPTIIIVGKGNQVLYRGHRAPKDWTKF
ncbi:MAG: TlpA disulfide reductase family protein [Verrucomicrobia bacterium]|nr:TlpA disulfide reductase family protein [Verrucomicrobiota bacterium]MDA1087115.1 TlpA disulfide reductase family protein [Verrucomicrobiota bacterium]